MPRIDVPSFLREVSLKQRHIDEFEEVLSNWLKVHAYISELEPTPESLRTLERMMVVELRRTPAPRAQIMQRLHGKYDRLRYEVERAQLTA